MDYALVSSPPQKKVERYATTLALIVILGPLFYGFGGMALNDAVRAIGNKSNLDAFAKSVAGVAGVIGGLIGANIVERLSDHIGRRGVLILAGPVLLLKATFGASSLWLGGYLFLLLCRVIDGMSFGSATAVTPGYIVEVPPERVRGRSISPRQLAIVLGLFSAATVNLIATKVAEDSAVAAFLGLKAWQIAFLCLLVPILVYMILTPLIPESPRYPVIRNQLGEAGKTLHKLIGQNDISGKIREIQDPPGGQDAILGTLAVLRSKQRTLVMVSTAIAAFQQLTGTNGIFFYSNMLLKAVETPESAAFLQTLILSIFKTVGMATGILLVDRAERRGMLVYDSTLVFIVLGTAAMVLLITPTGKNGPDISSSSILGLLAVILLCLFLLGFTSSWRPIFFVLMGEMLLNQVRGSVMSLSAEMDFLFNPLVVLPFPYLVSWSSSATYWIYCLFGVLAMIFAKRYAQETKSKSLEGMGR